MIQRSFGNRHLTYCSNIHPGESITGHLEQIDRYLPEVRKRIGSNGSMGMGLRISSDASQELMERESLDRLARWLQDRNLYVFTFNGFPYGSFHKTRVKESVHKPDWSTRERHDYTARLIDIMADLLPEGLEGSISTSPITYKYGFHSGHAMEGVERQAACSLADLAWKMEQLSILRGKEIHLDLEPEPDGYLETADEWIRFMKESMFREGVEHLSRQAGMSHTRCEQIIRRRIRLCYDTCHMALAWEEPASVLKRLDRDGLSLGKIQVSSALATRIPSDPEARERLREELMRFVEPVYLHQVVGITSNGEKRQYRDLPDALDYLDRCSETEWRIHFHIPLFRDPEGVVGSTRGHNTDLFKELAGRTDGRHLEVETYTWDLLPDDLKENLGRSIGSELQWVQRQLETVTEGERDESQ
ncbi:MAG: metabolite traffic protein EboE [Bacteroidota bacterium]